MEEQNMADQKMRDAANAGVDYDEPQIEGVVAELGDGGVIESMSGRARDELASIDKRLAEQIARKQDAAAKIKALRAERVKIDRLIKSFDRIEKADT